MPLVFTRDEIKEYLAEMGFGDLNEEDLNKFVQDLRKLIKVESRKRRRRRLGHTGHTHSEISSTTDEATVNSTPRGYDDDNIENNISTDQQQEQQEQQQHRRSQPIVTKTTTADQSHPQLLYTPKSRLSKISRHLNNTTSSEYSTTSNSTPHSQTSTISTTTTTTTSNGRYQPDSSKGEISSSFKNSTTPTTTFTTTTTTTDSTGVSETPYSETDNVQIRVRRVPLGQDNKANRQKPQHYYETAVDGGSSIPQERVQKKVPSKIISERENTKVFSRKPLGPADTELVSHPGSAEDLHSDKSSSSGSTDSLSDADLLRLMEHILKGDITLQSGETSEAGDTSNKKLEIPAKIRRDPVALYHWYKTFWDRQKPVGEDRHMQLRWNVRAGTVGKYPCDANGVKINYLPLNPIKQKKKISAF